MLKEEKSTRGRKPKRGEREWNHEGESDRQRRRESSTDCRGQRERHAHTE